MIAYSEKYDTTVELPDDLGPKDIQNVNDNFHTLVDPKPSGPPASTGNPGALSPAGSGNSGKSGNDANDAKPQYKPNFYEAYIKPNLGMAHDIAMATDFPFTQINPTFTPEQQAFGGKALEEGSFGASKSLETPQLAQEYKNHPIAAAAGAVLGVIGSLMESGAGLTALGLEGGAKLAGQAAVEQGIASGSRFIPPMIMSGATFGTRTFIAETVKAFQDKQVDLAKFGTDVAKDTAFGATLGFVGGMKIPTAAIASAAGLGWLSCKASHGDNLECALNAATWGTFEAIGAIGRNPELIKQAVGNLSDSVGEYFEARNPGAMGEDGAAKVGAQFVNNEIRKAGFKDIDELAKEGPEKTLQVIENVNQVVRKGIVPRGTAPEPPELPKLESKEIPPAPGQAEREPIKPLETPPSAKPEDKPEPYYDLKPDVAALARGEKLEAKPSDTIPPSISPLTSPETPPVSSADLQKHAETLLKMPVDQVPEDLKDVHHYMMQGIKMRDLSKSLATMYDQIGNVGVSEDERDAIADKYGFMATNTLGQFTIGQKAEDLVYQPVEEQAKVIYKVLADQRGIDKGEIYDAPTMHEAEKIAALVHEKFDHTPQKVVELTHTHKEQSDFDIAQMAYDRGLIETPTPELVKTEIENAKQEEPTYKPEPATEPIYNIQTKKFKYDRRGIPQLKGGAVVATLPDGTKIKHRDVVAEAEGMLQEANQNRDMKGKNAIGDFVIGRGGIKGFKGGMESKVPVRFRGDKEIDQIADEARESGLPVDNADDLRNILASIDEKGEKPTLAQFYDRALDSLVHEFSSMPKAMEQGAKYGGMEPQPTFYSKLEKTVAEKMPAKASPEQVMGLLKNSGVKDEEMDWLGIQDFLKDKKSVSKADLIDFIKQNNVQIQEVTKSEQADPNKVNFANVDKRTKFQQWQLPGGKNYRELLLTLPEINKSPEITPIWKQNRRGKWAWFRGENQVSGAYPEQADSENARQSIESQVDDKNFKSSHFSETNILSHVRFNDRTDAEGNKVLFLEEVQSDWHQKGREKGYANLKTLPDNFEVVKSGDIFKVYKKGFPTKNSLGQDTKYGIGATEQEAINNALSEIVRVHSHTYGVPNAPFKKTWHELALKRMLRYAAENGYDKLAWTTGEQQSERYDLINHVEEIAYWPDGTKIGISVIGTNGETIIDAELYDKEELPTVIGKDIARRIINDEGTEKPQTNGWDEPPEVHYLSGDNLKIGGEGMKGFYDQMLPSFLNKYAKKWGGKVDETTLDFGNDVKPVPSLEITPSMKESVMQGQALFEKPSNPNQQELKFQSPYEEDNVPQKQGEANAELPTVRGGFKALQTPHLESEFKENGFVIVPNRQIASPADIAFPFQELHKQAREHSILQAIKDGHVVAVELLGIGTIDQAPVYPFETINILDKVEADGYALTHNHPGGDVQFSSADMRMTDHIKSVLSKNGLKFYGHVIINDTKFGFIDPDGKFSIHEHAEYKDTKKVPILEKYFEWKKSKSEIMGGPAITGPESAFEMFKGIQLDKENGGVALLNNHNKLLNLVIVPHGKFNTGVIQRLAAAYRANGVITVNSGLKMPEWESMQSELKNADIRLHDNVQTEEGNKVQSFARNKLREQQELYNVPQENLSDKYNRLIQQAKSQGLNPLQASKWAKNEMKNPTPQAPQEAKPSQQEFNAGGVQSFGGGEKGQSELFEPRGIYNAQPVAEQLKEAGTEIRNLVAPYKAAPLASEILRENLGKQARAHDMAAHALEGARKLFDKFTKEQVIDFVDRYEHGIAQPTSDLEQIAKVLKQGNDWISNQLRALGKFKESFFKKNYLGQMWEQKDDKVSKILSERSKRPMEGSKGFTKQRTYDYFKDGVKAGLTPVTWNPVEMYLLKRDQAMKFITAHNVIKDWRAVGLSKRVMIGDDKPEGWIKIDDNISTIYKSPMIAIKEAYDKQVMDKLTAVSDSLGIEHERKTNIGGSRWGVSRKSAHEGEAGEIKTKFAGPESVLAHEIGHQLDDIYGLRDKFMKKELQPEFRALADMRFEGKETTEGFQRYVRKGAEKMAVMLEAYVHAPDKFKEVAPTVFKMYDEFLKSHKELKPLTKIKPSLVLGTGTSEVYAGGMVIAGHEYAEPNAARLINNYLSPGLSKSAVFRLARMIGNTINQAQLGLSLFHLNFTSMEAVATQIDKAIRSAIGGNLKSAIGQLGKVPIAPVSTLIKGDLLMKAWNGEKGSPIYDQLADILARSGGRAHMDQFYSTQMVESMKHNFKTGGLAVGKGLLQVPLAALDASSKPVMEMIVPRMKLGIFAEMMKMEIQNNPGMTKEQEREVGGRIWDTIDDRMGQVVYDNIFWDKTFKDSLMLMFRSVGWNHGLIRLAVGAPRDAAQMIGSLMKGEKPKSAYNLSYWIASAIALCMFNAIYQKLRTGHGPQELKDYVFPRNGRLDPDGNASRSIPFQNYYKDLYHMATAPEQTLTNKLNPLLGMVYEAMNNKDFYGQKIINSRNDLLLTKLEAEVMFALKFVRPFSLSNTARNIAEGGHSLESVIGPWVGDTSAPYDINQTKAETLAHEINASHREISGRTEEQVDETKIMYSLENEFRTHDPKAQDDLQKAYKTGQVSKYQMREVIANSKLTPLQKQVRRMGLDDATDVYNVATDAEKAQLQTMMERKKENYDRNHATAGVK